MNWPELAGNWPELAGNADVLTAQAFTESVVEEAPLEWLESPGDRIAHGPNLIESEHAPPPEPRAPVTAS